MFVNNIFLLNINKISFRYTDSNICILIIQLQYQRQIKRQYQMNSQPDNNLASLKNRIQLALIDDRLNIQMKDMQGDRFRGTYTFEQLPLSFHVLFENVQQLYVFLHGKIDEIELANSNLCVLVPVANKDKLFELPLELQPLSAEQRLIRDLKKAQEQLILKNKQIFQLREKLNITQRLLQEKNTIIQTLQHKLSQNQKDTTILKAIIRKDEWQREDLKIEKLQNSQENSIQHKEELQILKEMQQEKPFSTQKEFFMDKQEQREDLSSKEAQPQLSSKEAQPQQQERIIQEPKPNKKRKVNRKPKFQFDFGTKLSLKLDQASKYYNKFTINENQIQKLNGPTYQLYAREALDRTGKFHFDIRLLNIKHNNLVVGIISAKNKEQQFSYKKANCICYNGYDGSICVQVKQTFVGIKPKDLQKIRTVIDVNVGQVQWYFVNCSGQQYIGKATIPNYMLKQQLLPYFQLYWPGNKVQINV